MKKFQGHFVYAMAITLIAPIFLDIKVSNYPRFLLTATAIAVLLALVFLLVDHLFDKQLKQLLKGKNSK